MIRPVAYSMHPAVCWGCLGTGWHDPDEVDNDKLCEDCAGTTREPIPWAEVVAGLREDWCKR
jgi:hypothetical protein